jgi:hypothetical protein
MHKADQLLGPALIAALSAESKERPETKDHTR